MTQAPHPLVSLSVAVSVFLCLGTCLCAQGTPGKTPLATALAEASELKSYALKYSSVETICDVIEHLFSGELDIRVAPDTRSNSIIVLASGEQHAKLQAILERLDTPAPNDKQIKAFEMNSETIDKSSDVLSLMHADAELAIAEGMLVVRGKKEAVDEVTQLVELISKAAERSRPDSKPASQDAIQIEIVLLSEMGGTDLADFTGPIAEALKKRGFRNVHQLSHIEVSTLPGQQAHAMGAAWKGSIRTEIQVANATENDHLSVSLDVEAEINSSPIEFATAVSVPMNHWIVFGIADAPGMTKDSATPDKNAFLMRVKPLEPLPAD